MCFLDVQYFLSLVKIIEHLYGTHCSLRIPSSRHPRTRVQFELFFRPFFNSPPSIVHPFVDSDSALTLCHHNTLCIYLTTLSPAHTWYWFFLLVFCTSSSFYFFFLFWKGHKRRIVVREYNHVQSNCCVVETKSTKSKHLYGR